MLLNHCWCDIIGGGTLSIMVGLDFVSTRFMHVITMAIALEIDYHELVIY